MSIFILGGLVAAVVGLGYLVVKALKAAPAAEQAVDTAVEDTTQAVETQAANTVASLADSAVSEVEKKV